MSVFLEKTSQNESKQTENQPRTKARVLIYRKS